MFISSIVCHLIALCFLNSYHALEQLPEDIAPTEEIRDVVNQIFSGLKLKRKQDSKLGEYSTIHKHFVGLTQLENDSWKRVRKLTTIDSRIDNGTTDLTTIINEILNEENNTVETNGTPNDDDVNEYIDNFLSTLARLKEVYLANDSYSSINTDVLEHFYRNSVSERNFNYTGVDEFNSTDSSNSTDELEFWTPTETRRIYKGKRTKIKYFPFLASVHMFDQFTCAGSVIHSSLVVTAASCLQLAYNNRFFRENPAFLAVRIGSPFFNGGGERIPVLEVYFYPTYTPRTLKDNIAVMRLQKVIKFRRGKRNVRKIEIDRSDWNLPVNSRGVTIAGWGAKSASNKIMDPWSNKVSMAHLPIYPFEDCQGIYSKEYVTRKNFCAGFFSKGGGACNRDVGAPGVANGRLMGIASFGAPSCGTVDAPTVFTKVGYYHDWIETIMEQDVPHAKTRTTIRPYEIPQKVVSYVVEDPKHFKIEPIDQKEIRHLIDITNLNRLRMDETNKGHQDTKFENFLGTMFNDKNLQEHNDELPNVKRQKPKAEENNYNSNKINEELVTTPSVADEGNFEPVKFVTTFDAFDPEPITSREADLDEDLTEWDKIVQTDDLEGHGVDDKTEASETKGQTTPILEEYGLSIELSDKSKEEKQHDISYFDSERKHQIDKSDETARYTNDSGKFNRNPNFQVDELNVSNKDINYETSRDLNPLDDYFDTHQLNKKSRDHLRELEELINEGNENTQYNNEWAQEMAIPNEPLKQSLNTQAKREQKVQKPSGPSVKDVAVGDNTTKHPNNKQLKFPVEFSEESVKYKDVIDQLNKEHQAEEPQLNNDQENEPDAISSDTLQAYTLLYDKRQRPVKESYHQVAVPYVPERHVELQRLKQGKKISEIDNNLFKTEPIQQADLRQQLDSRENNPKNKRWQHQAKKPGIIIKEFRDQEVEPDISEGYANANTGTKTIHHNQDLKGDDTSTDIDVSPFLKSDHQVSEQDKLEKNARPKLNTKLQTTEKFMQYSDIKYSQNQVRKEAVYSHFSNNSEDQFAKLNESKYENIDKKLDEQIDQLLKNLDVENKVGSGMIQNSNDKKVIEDDTLLAFLLMTDNERSKNGTTKEIADSDEESEYNGKEGMNIDGEHYEDLTHSTNATDDSYKIMSKSEMYDILLDTVQADDGVIL